MEDYLIKPPRFTNWEHRTHAGEGVLISQSGVIPPPQLHKMMRAAINIINSQPLSRMPGVPGTELSLLLNLTFSILTASLGRESYHHSCLSERLNNLPKVTQPGRSSGED